MVTESEIKNEMNKAFQFLLQELQGLRTGRANAALLDRVQVEVYGTKMRLKDVANITTPEPRQLLITPYDANNASAIGKGIENANLNVQPIVDSNVVRINIPPMTEELRKQMVKECHRKGEATKVEIRNTRRRFNDALKTEGKPEDETKRDEKMIQDITNKFCSDVDDVCKKKEKEILEI